MEPATPHGFAPGSVKAHRLLLILLLALGALVQFTVASRTVVYLPFRADAGEYFSYAYNLSHHGVYSSSDFWRSGDVTKMPTPDKSRPPGYPLFLIAVGTPEPTATYIRRVVFVQALLGVLSVWLAYLIARKFLSGASALVVGALTILSPHIMLSSTLILSEGLFTFLLLASVLASIRAFREQRSGWFLAAGSLWAASTLVRPTVALFPVLMLAWAAMSLKRRQLLGQMTVGVLAFSLLLAPWAIRNLSVAPGSSLLLNSIAHGSYPQFMMDGKRSTWGFPYRFDPAYPAYARTTTTLLAKLKEKFERNPSTMLRWYLLEKPVYLLSLKDLQSVDIQIYPLDATPYYERRSYAAMRIATILMHWPLMLLGVVGAILAVGAPGHLKTHATARMAATMLALLLAYIIALHVATAPYPRYAIPFRPLIFALAMFTLERGWQVFRMRPRAGT